MKCLNCQFENPAGMNFCGQCGTRLHLVCPRCSATNLPQAKFCGDCGHRLAQVAVTSLPKDLTFDQKLAKIQKYLPSGLTEKILSQKGRIEGERRHVNIMFVDMKGFTPLTEELGAEETFALMDRVFEILIRKIHDYEGTVNELRGDGVLALFGAPVALEDSPQRAIRSALAIHREMAKFSEKIKDEKKIPPILLRIGINSGPVVVGSVGNDFRVQFTAVGDTINMAARMEQLAEPGTTYVTEETFRLTEGLFRFEALGEKEIKGKTRPVKVYRVIAPSSRLTRFDVSAERGLTGFVGRHRELARLVDGFELAKRGRGQAVSIVGEAGVGKSRLLYEFRKAISNEDVTFLEGRCLSYGRGMAYHPMIEVLKSYFRVEDEDADADTTEKVKRRLAKLELEEASTLPYLLELLSVKDSGVDSIRMSPQAMKDRILGALRRLILRVSEKKPLVLAIEDLQLMDKSSEEAAKHLRDSIPDARVLMIFTYRPEFIHTWGGKSFHSQVALNHLSNRECLDMAAYMLGGDLASDLQGLILDKAEGVPFFVEEFVRTLMDMAIIEKPNHAYHLGKDIDHVVIPSTIQDVIMARVDSLPEAAKEVLQVGSAIEREFNYELIRAVTDLPERELLSHLSALKAAALIYERGIYPQSVYLFKHSLTREVVYDSILTNKKKALHQKIGEAIEELYRGRLDPYHSILADHFMISEDFQKSANYSRETYERARIQAAFTSQISYAQKRITALERLPISSEVELQLIGARIDHGLTMLKAGEPARAKEAIEPIAEIALEKNDRTWLGQVYLILGFYQSAVEEDVTLGHELLQKAIKNAEGATDLVSVMLAHYFYGMSLCWDCQFEGGAEEMRKALAIYEATQNLWGVSAMHSNLSHYAYNYQGKVEEGFSTSLKALDIAETSGDIFSRAMAYVSHGISCFYKGFFEPAEEHLLKGLDLSEKIQLNSYLAIGHQALGYAYFELGDYNQAEDQYQKAIHFRHKTGIYPSCVSLNKVALARASLAVGERDLDIPSLTQLVRSSKSKWYFGKMARHLAEILHQVGEPHFAEVENWLRAAILSHEQQGMIWDLACDYMTFAQMLRSNAPGAREKEYLDKSLMLFRQCGAEGWCNKIETGLA